MFGWFERIAPIRMKFRALFFVHGGIAALSLIATWFALHGGGNWMLAVSGLAFLLTLATVQISGTLICTPYVNTVVRMEALARGDTASPIQYTDYEDCVGRMTKAMSVFRENSEKVASASETQENVVRRLADGLSQLSNGNLTHVIKEPFPGDYDRLRESFNQAVRGLDQSLGHVAASAERVLSGSTEIRGASEDLSRRTEQQAASLEETSAAMTRVTGMVSESASAAGDMRGAIEAANKDASEGGDVVRRAVSAMDAIEKSSQEISQIINVIDGIAFQTNLLALNAGVEAARAGDAGKGFAVVANEVRALAQRSADAAKDIKNLITTSSTQVEQGVGLVGETGEMLARIVGKIADINGLIADMAASSEEQSSHLQQVNGAVTDMDKMTQQNAAMVEETTAAARSLAGEADELAALVTRFQLSATIQPAAIRRSAAASKQAASAHKTRAAVPATSGNLALKVDSEEDWTDF